jgi:hypothetical protein
MGTEPTVVRQKVQAPCSDPGHRDTHRRHFTIDAGHLDHAMFGEVGDVHQPDRIVDLEAEFLGVNRMRISPCQAFKDRALQTALKLFHF